MRILMKTTAGWKPVASRPYGLEVRLEDLLLESPEIIPMDSEAPEGTRVVYAKQFGIAGHSLDLVGIGSDGTISIVECKLATNSAGVRHAKRSRRFIEISPLHEGKCGADTRI